MRHDPFSEFVYAGVLVVITHYVPVVKFGIQQAWKSFSSSHLNIVKVPGSEGVGVVERILYIYCLTSAHREFIGSVLLFKAFSNWLIVQQTGANQAAASRDTNETQVGSEHAEKQDGPLDERHVLLAKFYTYAMGNFISLLFAIFFYEVVHLWGMKVLPVIPLDPFYLK